MKFFLPKLTACMNYNNSNIFFLNAHIFNICLPAVVFLVRKLMLISSCLLVLAGDLGGAC